MGLFREEGKYVVNRTKKNRLSLSGKQIGHSETQ
jgi:hypothetical protein